MPVKKMEIRDKILLGRPIMIASDGRIQPNATTKCTIANNFNNFNNIDTIASQTIPKVKSINSIFLVKEIICIEVFRL